MFAFLLLLLCVTAHSSQAASAHIHQHKAAGSKERIEDGAFGPGVSKHYGDGQEHHSEFDHEAILGSVKDAEEYDKLPVEESKRRLGLLLTKMDLNNDEFVDRHELKAWILRSFNMLSEEESKERLEDADENRDGKITWEEILQDSYSSDLEELPIEDETYLNDKETFTVADLDNDGYLDEQEFKAYTHPEETPRMIDVLVNQALRVYDTNNDSFIDFQEYLQDKAEGEGKEWLISEKEKFDGDYDKNADGKLDIAEMKTWLIPSSEDIAIDEVNHLFGASDDDHDDRLSFDEILEHHDVFVGSEATDFGDHLQDIDRFRDEL
ncbi:reticulocalbin-2 [Copidosoma floridanum]|uniref:reticulocalbin-2 n=1 Tax=Copidosoma floridanum TaxID=29053 RepID=UPI0006C9D0BE|nr:reticulocalbin-2 [Copidosoma floridanum]